MPLAWHHGRTGSLIGQKIVMAWLPEGDPRRAVLYCHHHLVRDSSTVTASTLPGWSGVFRVACDQSSEILPALLHKHGARVGRSFQTETLVAPASGDFPFRVASLAIIFKVFPVRSYCLQSQGAVATLLVTASV